MLSELYEIADSNNIAVMSVNCAKCGSISIRSDNGDFYIGIDKNVHSEQQEQEHLAHELGHCIKGAFYNRYSTFNNILQQEYKADKWAVEKLIPLRKLKTMIRQGTTEVWELAESFDVSEDFMKRALYVYGFTY